MRVPLESIDFYVKVPKIGEQNFLCHCRLAERSSFGKAANKGQNQIPEPSLVINRRRI
jgi:hypothetical protein